MQKANSEVTLRVLTAWRVGSPNCWVVQESTVLYFLAGAKIRMARIASLCLSSFTQDKMKSEKKGASHPRFRVWVDSLGGQQKVICQRLQASLSITNSRSSLRLTSIKSAMPSSHLILCHPLLLLPPIPPSMRVFSNESTLHTRWPKYWSFSFSISPSNEYPGLISFRMDWLDLLAIQETHSQESSPTPQLKSINSSALSFPYSPTLASIYDHSLD